MPGRDPQTNRTYMRDYYANYAQAARGHRPLVDAAPVRQHIRLCRGAGMSAAAIATAAGVSLDTVNRILGHRCHQLRTAIADRLLSVNPQGTITAVGLTRRVRALAVLGWSVTQIAAAANLSLDAVKQYRRGEVTQPRPSGVVGVLAAYQALSMARPPRSTRWERTAAAGTVSRARRAGWVPPLAWDDDEIDDPAARPHIAAEVRLPGGKRVFLDDVELLISEGHTVAQIAGRLGCSMDAIEQQLRRNGHTALLARMQRNAA